MKRIIGAVLAVVMAVSLVTVTAGAAPSILDTSKTKLVSGEAKSIILSTLNAGETDFSIKLSENGNLKIKVECKRDTMIVGLFDSKGNEIGITKRTATLGTWGDFGNKENRLKWSEKNEKSKGVIEYKNLKKGTYYIRFGKANSMGRGFKYTVKATFPDVSSSTEVKEVTVEFPLKKGQSVQLGASLTPADGTGAISWKSNKTSVATVSATGKVTAVGKGTAVITYTAGKGSAKIIIKVS